MPPMEREGFKDMIESLQSWEKEGGHPSNVLVYEVSRLGRNFWEMLDAIKLLESKWPIISTSPKEVFLQVTDRSMRQLFITIFAWAAERERELTSQRTQDGLDRARDQEHHIGNLPLGYDQHVCKNLNHLRCEKSGLLSLNREGGIVFEMLQFDAKLRPKTVMSRLGISDYMEARRLIKNVRKFGRPKLAPQESGTAPPDSDPTSAS